MQEDLTNDVRYVAPPSLNSKMDDYNMNLETEVSVESIFRTGEEVSQLDKFQFFFFFFFEEKKASK